MFKNFLIITALVFCTSFGANAASKIWDDGCNCYLPDKIKTITPEPKTYEQAQKDFNAKRKNYENSKREHDWLRKNLTPEEKSVWNKKGLKWKEVSSPSYCIGYAKEKMEQHPSQIYYKEMYDFYDEKVSSTDLMAEPIDNEALLRGYNLDDDSKIMECVNAYDKRRGFN